MAPFSASRKPEFAPGEHAMSHPDAMIDMHGIVKIFNGRFIFLRYVS